jgi:hypothetical protein
MCDYLKDLSITNSSVVIGRLTRGVHVAKSASLSYLIDNVNVDERLGNFPVGAIPYSAINKALQSSSSRILNLFSGESSIPFSKVMKYGVGQCLEKAILVQLAAQRIESSYLVSGAIELDSDSGVDFQAFNLVFRGNTVYLVDAENPFSKDKEGSVIRRYIVPVKEITAEGIVVVQDEYRAGRTYSLEL